MPQRHKLIVLLVAVLALLSSVPSAFTNMPSLSAGASGALAASSIHPTTAPASAGALFLPLVGSEHAITTVFLIMMENHNWSDIYLNPSAPYINQTLLP